MSADHVARKDEAIPQVPQTTIPEAGHDLEHYVAALCQAGGYFVAKNLYHRDPTDLLELDVVVLDYSDAKPVATLIEAKGGNFGWSDMFKMLGWMQYLDISHGVLFCSTADQDDIKLMCEKLEPIGLIAASFDGFDDPMGTFTDAGFDAPTDDALVSLWRHSFSIEHKISQKLGQLAKSNAALTGPSTAVAYQRLVNDGTFFAREPVQRLTMLYSAYKDHPRLTLACAEEKAGNGFDPQVAATANTHLTEAMQDGEHFLLQATMYLEHRGRLALLQAAIDYACEYPEGPPQIIEGQIDWTAMLYACLPQTFHDGIAWLREQPSFRRFGIFWQQLLWGWGGFYLDHKQEEEFQWMAEYARIPVEQIPDALRAFDRLFPVPSGWIRSVGPSSALQVKMMPTYFKGLGVHHRRQQYELDSFNEIGGKQYTGSDMARWNNSAVSFLTP